MRETGGIPQHDLFRVTDGLAMNEGLHRTARLLTTTRNLAAVDVLLPALDAKDPQIRLLAIESLLERKNRQGQIAIISRFAKLDADSRQVVRSFAPTLGRALRTALVDKDLQLRKAACQAIRWLGEQDFIPILVGALEHPNQEFAEELVETLYELLSSNACSGSETPGDKKSLSTSRAATRKQILRSLEGSIERFPHHRRDELVEAFFMVADATNPLLHSILGKAEHPCYAAAVRVLTTSSRPRLWQLLIELLRQDHPPAGLPVVLSSRGDGPFVQFFVEHLGNDLSHRALQMLKRLETVVWLTPGETVLKTLKGEHVRKAARFLRITGLSRQQRFDLLAFLIDDALPEGRVAAVESLSELTGEDVNRLLLECLEDHEPGVQAAATGNLRSRSIPGALGILLSKLDSRHESVRQAAREALNEYRFSRFLAAFDQLDETASRQSGQLIKKIDPDTVPLLRQEFDSPNRSHRLRALRIAETLQVVDDVQGQLAELLGNEEEDAMVRTEAARLLGKGSSVTIIKALQDASSVSNPRVRSQAELSLEQILARNATDESALRISS